jgi:integrase
MLDLFKRRLDGARHGRPIFVDWGSGNRDLQANWARARRRLVEGNQELEHTLPRGLTFNDLRRTFCSLMRNAGVSFEDCATLLGHTDIEMVRTVYGRTAMDTLHAAVARLPSIATVLATDSLSES